MTTKLYQNIKKLNEWTEGLLVKVLKLRLTGIQNPIFEARLRGETTGNIKKSLGIDDVTFQEADEIVKRKVRDYRQEARKWYNATEAEKNRINLLSLLSQLEKYKDMSEEEREECFGNSEIPENYRKGAEAFLRFLLG